MGADSEKGRRFWFWKSPWDGAGGTVRRLRVIQRGLQVGHIKSRWASGSTKGEAISSASSAGRMGWSLEKGKSRTRRLDGLDPKVGE